MSDDYKNVEKESLDTSSNEGETIIVPDPLPRKWNKKDVPVDQQQQYKKTNSKTNISIDLNPHQLFQLFFDDEVVTYLCEQSKIYGNFVFHVTPDKFCAF